LTARLRVLVVEDSLTIRRRLVEVLEQDPTFEVVAEAADGQQAIDRCLRYRPDVITMDMMLPVLSGLAATEYIMAHRPTPILVVSSSFNRGEMFKTYDALAAGAVDVIEKPAGDEPSGAWEDKFRSALRIVARVRVITHPRARLSQMRREPPAAAADVVRGRPLSLLALGASTGGPTALLRVLGALPKECTLPILIVLHITAPFALALAEWLDSQLPRRVGFAAGGESVRSLSNRVVLAPPDRHLVVRAGRLALTTDVERYFCRPSVDTLFESVAAEYGSAAAGCLLTGMGRDGAVGLLALRRAGAPTIAQDEATSVVYGMPREAALLGAAEQILPLDGIGGALGALARAGNRERSR
jgi:two-component system, chemotaxis family, protein-glutamate methylesterase/glutaminase